VLKNFMVDESDGSSVVIRDGNLRTLKISHTAMRTHKKIMYPNAIR